MTTWNYRVLRRQDPTEGDTYQIHEVYYDDTGQITMWSEHPAELAEGTVEDLKDALMAMLEALNKQPLKETLIQGKEQLLPTE